MACGESESDVERREGEMWGADRLCQEVLRKCRSGMYYDELQRKW